MRCSSGTSSNFVKYHEQSTAGIRSDGHDSLMVQRPVAVGSNQRLNLSYYVLSLDIWNDRVHKKGGAAGSQTQSSYRSALFYSYQYYATECFIALQTVTAQTVPLTRHSHSLQTMRVPTIGPFLLWFCSGPSQWTTPNSNYTYLVIIKLSSWSIPSATHYYKMYKKHSLA